MLVIGQWFLFQVKDEGRGIWNSGLRMLGFRMLGLTVERGLASRAHCPAVSLSPEHGIVPQFQHSEFQHSQFHLSSGALPLGVHSESRRGGSHNSLSSSRQHSLLLCAATEGCRSGDVQE